MVRVASPKAASAAVRFPPRVIGGRFDARCVTHPGFILISSDDSDAAGGGKLEAEMVDGCNRFHSHEGRTSEDGIVRRSSLDHHEARHGEQND